MAWTGIFGHIAQCEMLDRRLESDEESGAMLFYGPSGIGKHTVAREFSRKHFCLETGSKTCRCSQCVRFQTGGNYDFVDIDLFSLPVEEIRKIVEAASFAPNGDRLKVIILDNVDKAHYLAPSILLKAVEESSYAVFILLAESLDRMGMALASRCRKVPFFRLLSKDLEVLAASFNLDISGRSLAIELSGGRASELRNFNSTVIEKLAFLAKDIVSCLDRSDLVGLLKLTDRVTEDKFFPEVLAMLQLAVRKALKHKSGVVFSTDALVNNLACLRKDVLFEVENEMDFYSGGVAPENCPVLLNSLFLSLIPSGPNGR